MQEYAERVEALDFDTPAPEMRSATLMEANITGRKFVGYAAVYDAVADLGEFTEESQRGSFRKVLAQQRQPVPFYYDHNDQHGPLAHTGAGTLRLSDDTRGLHVEADLPQHHPQVRMLEEQMERGEIRHMSYGFVAGRGNSRVENRQGRPHRVLTGYAALLDVSPTWRPAYTATSAELRHALFALIPDLSQPTVGGSHQQPDGGVTPQEDTTVDADPVEDTDTSAEVAPVDESSQEQDQDSGVAEARALVAARRRRLQMMGLTLPPDLRRHGNT